MSSSPWPSATSPSSSPAASSDTGRLRARLAGEAERDPEILAVERDLEAERVVVLEHPAAAVREDPALSRSPAERADDLLDVEAGLHREDDALGDAEVRPGEDHLVDGLDRLAGADRADVGDRRAERRRTGRARSTSAASPPTKIESVAFWAPSLPPDTGRVDHRDAAFAASRAAKSRVARRRDRRAVDDERAGAGALGDAVGAEEDRLDVGRVRDADDDDVRGGRRGRRRRRRGRRRGRRAPARGPGVRFQARDREARSGEVRGHRRAHRPETEKRDALVRHGTLRLAPRRHADAAQQIIGENWRARRDSNSRPLGPQPNALSTELRAHAMLRMAGGEGGFEPPMQVNPTNGLANRRTRPLCDLSVAQRWPCYHGSGRLPRWRGWRYSDRPSVARGGPSDDRADVASDDTQ